MTKQWVPNTNWLFGDSIIGTAVLQFVEFKEEFKTSTGKKIPALIFVGTVKAKDKDGKVETKGGDFICSTWSILVDDEFKKKYAHPRDMPPNTMVEISGEGEKIFLREAVLQEQID